MNFVLLISQNKNKNNVIILYYNDAEHLQKKHIFMNNLKFNDNFKKMHNPMKYKMLKYFEK